MTKRLFDAYLMVDWSAAARPTRAGAPDTIWIAACGPGGSSYEAHNFRTRSAAMAFIEGHLRAAFDAGSKVLAGFDFVFGYPRGASAMMTGEADWQAVWRLLHARIEDGDDNANNRFEVANALNEEAFDKPVFWGRPAHRRDLAHLPARKETDYSRIPEKRISERYFSGSHPIWKLYTTGAVGGQSMIGMARLEALRRRPGMAGRLKVWPFETGFERALPEGPSAVLLEIYPSVFRVEEKPGEVRDLAQVRTVTTAAARLDEDGALASFLAAPPGTNEEERRIMLSEEGSIFGAGLL